ncbi:acetate kinase [Bacteroidales bacterium OttesenSCG-928-L14]|nr:acetate kinase [Bacteroidales bacterium OttesenSCG-928-L14]
MKILVLNCGSSSIKYQLFDMPNEEVLAKGIVEKIGLNDSFIKHEKIGFDKEIVRKEIPSHKVGLDSVLELLVDPKIGSLKSIDELGAVGHRVVHGGEKFNGSVVITEEVVNALIECIPLAPLHNPPNIEGIKAMQAVLPNVLQVGVFDTAFHQTMPEYSYLYAVPYEMYGKYGIRRYGFHGTSHKYISAYGAELMDIDYNNSKIITCHLGNGSSIAAVKNGQSMDTSMGLTPVEGVMMGTRCGDLDVGAVLAIAEFEGFGLKEINTFINKKCGLLGVSGVSSDMRDLEVAAEDGNPRCKLALEMFAYRVKKYIGAYAAAMGGVDLIVFAGGIGENDMNTRANIMKDMEFLGIDFNFELNAKTRGKTQILSKENSKVKVIVVETNEELVIARDTFEKI